MIYHLCHLYFWKVVKMDKMKNHPTRVVSNQCPQLFCFCFVLCGPQRFLRNLQQGIVPFFRDLVSSPRGDVVTSLPGLTGGSPHKPGFEQTPAGVRYIAQS